MSEAVLSEARVTGLRRLLLAVCGMAGVLVIIAALIAGNGYGRFAIVVLVCAALLAFSAGLALRALPRRDDTAKRLCILTAVTLILVSLPLVSIVVGTITVMGGVGLLVVLFAPEKDDA